MTDRMDHPIRYPVRDGELWLLENFLEPSEADRLFHRMQQNIPWKQEKITVFGKTHPIPRLTCWHGDPGCAYTYSGLRSEPEPWTEELRMIRARLQDILPHPDFNSVLLNFYRSGEEKMGWHADDERELGPDPVIASVSLGATRRFDLKHRRHADQRLSIPLPTGSLLVMAGAWQHHWVHQLPAQKKVTAGRINLTFRHIRKSN